MRLLLAAALVTAAPVAAQDAALLARVDRVLARTPLVDGHNDLPWALRETDNGLALDLKADSRTFAKPLQTDLTRLKQGRVGAQFWSVWIPATTKGAEAVRTTIEQIDMVRRIVARYPAELEMARTAADIRRIHKAGRIASLIGVEGGDQIGGSLAVLRQYRALGASYMTLTHSLTTDWADSATDNPKHNGLTAFGETVVREMNRIGMLVDLSHVAPNTMRDAIQASRAPVIFSHSSARGLVDHPRDVPDDILPLVAANGGVVMATFVPGFVSEELRRWNADREAEIARTNDAPAGGLYLGQPERAKAAMDAWDAAHPKPKATLKQVADHIDHIAKVAGHDHVGLGGDFDGIPEGPEGLKGVDSYPALLAELMRRGWSDADIAKLAGGNILRAMERADAIAVTLKNEPPSVATIEIDSKNR